LAAVLAVGATMLAAMGIPRAADIEVTIAASGMPGDPWIEQLTGRFMTVADRELAGTTTRITWRLTAEPPDGEPGAAFDLVKSGEAELALVSVRLHPWSLYPQNVGFATPFACGDAATVARAVDRLNAAFPALDRAWASLGLVYLGGGFAHGPYVMMTTFPVTSPDDLEGKRLSAPELAVDWMWGLGATTLPGDDETFKVGLETGKIDGVVIPAWHGEHLGLDDLAPFVTDMGFGSVFEGGLVANRDWFDGLRPTVQTALREAASAYGVAVKSRLATAGSEALAAMAARGTQIGELTQSDRRWWAGQLPDLAADWAYELDVRDLPGSDLVAAYMQDLSQSCGAPLRAWTAGAPP
jgi:TRAP-type C4-dicarboxylate transport system substrate-binding protein